MDLLTYAFEGPVKHNNEPLFIEARNSVFSLTFSQTRLLVRSLVTGLQATRLQPVSFSTCLIVYGNAFLQSDSLDAE